MNKQIIKIAPETLILAVALLVGAYLLITFLLAVRFVLVILFFGMVFAQAVEPLIAVFERNRVRRRIAILLSYLIFLQILLAIGAIVVPSLILQLQQIITNLPFLIVRLQELLGMYWAFGELILPSQLEEAVAQLATNLAEFLPSLLLLPLQLGSIVVAGTLTLVISVYWLLMGQDVRAGIFRLIPAHARPEAEEIFADMGSRVGGWVRGQIILSAAIGVFTFVGLVLLNVPFAVVLAAWAAITELIPMAGPIIGAIPAVLVAFIISPLHAVLVAILYFAIQQLEAHLLVPNVMSREVGLNPLVVILALLFGVELMGIVGALLAVPLAAVVQVLVEHAARRFQDPSDLP